MSEIGKHTEDFPLGERQNNICTPVWHRAVGEYLGFPLRGARLAENFNSSLTALEVKTQISSQFVIHPSKWYGLISYPAVL